MLFRSAQHFGPSRRASVSRELTKIHEETCRGTLQELALQFEQRSQIKGEIVLVVEGHTPAKKRSGHPEDTENWGNPEDTENWGNPEDSE